jgi:hypothetical protein
MSNTVHNERVKAAAALLNMAAASCFSVGIAAPIVASYISGTFNIGVAIGVLAWMPALAVLHVRAQRILGRLTDE